MTNSEKLIDYALEAFTQNFPADITTMAIQAIIDQFGLQIGGSDFSWSRAVYQYTLSHSRTTGLSTVTRYGDKLSPLQASFLNSCFAHAQDFDDSHQEAQTHPGSVIIPPAIALGECLKLDAEVVLKAIIIGMEIMLRLAHSICPVCIEGGHHTPPTVGPFGAAIAAGLLLGLSKEQLVNALGICGSFAGGLVEYTLSGGSVKRLHTAIGARAGLEAALLAQQGITGPKTIIEGKKGLWAIFGRGKAVEERLLQDIGEKFLLGTLMFKPYNCCYLIHPAIQSFLMLCQQHNIASDDIKAVTVGMSHFSISHVGKIIIPHDELGAQFSTSFSLALALITGAPGMHSYNQAALRDQRIIELATKITIELDETAESEFPHKNGCLVTVYTQDAQKFTLRMRDAKGSPDNLLTSEEVKTKFLANTRGILTLEQTLGFYDALLSFRSIKLWELHTYLKESTQEQLASLA